MRADTTADYLTPPTATDTQETRLTPCLTFSNRNVLLSLMRAAGRDCTAGLAQVMHSEVMVPLLGAAAGPSPAILSNGAEGSTAFPLVYIEPVAPQNGATVYPFSKSAVLRRLLSDQVGF